MHRVYFYSLGIEYGGQKIIIIIYIFVSHCKVVTSEALNKGTTAVYEPSQPRQQ